MLISVLGGTGYFFADKSSEPEYKTKIDRILFDTKNKSPKFVITLPDGLRIVKSEETPKAIEERLPVEQKIKQSKEEFLKQLMKETPAIPKLSDFSGYAPLAEAERNSNYEQEVQGQVLPKIGSNGQKPWIVFAQEHPKVQPNFYRVSIIITGLGLNRRLSQEIMTKLPKEVAFSFSPYGEENVALIKNARLLGHETYADLLLSPKDMLKSDNGPLSLSLNVSHEENILRLYKSIAASMPNGGVVVSEGIVSDDVEEGLSDLLDRVSKMGLLMIDATGENELNNIAVTGLARRKSDIIIEEYTPQEIAQKLSEAEEIAQKQGSVLIVSGLKASAIKALNEWVKTFSPQLTYEQMKEQNITEIERPFALVPISAIVVE